MAAKARDRLEIVLQPFGGAEDEINQLFTGYDTANNFAPATIGQVKSAASRFWKRLQQVGAPEIPVAPAVPYERNGVKVWTGDQADDADDAPATLGQLKMAFSFDIPANAPPLQNYATGMQSRFWNPVLNANGLVVSGIIAGDVPQTMLYHFGREVKLKPGTQVTFATVGSVGPFVRTGTLGIDMALDYGVVNTVTLMAGTTFSFTTVTVGTARHSFVSTGTLAEDQPLIYSYGTDPVFFKKGSQIFFAPAVSLPMQYVSSGTLAFDQSLFYDFNLPAVTMQGGTVVPFVRFGNRGNVSMGVLATATEPQELFYSFSDSLKFQPGSHVIFAHRQENTNISPGGNVRSGIAGENKSVQYSSYPADQFVIKSGSPCEFFHRPGSLGNSSVGYLISGVLFSNTSTTTPSSSELPYTYGSSGVIVKTDSFVTFRHFNGSAATAIGLVETATLDGDQFLDYSYDFSANQGIKIKAKDNTSVEFEFVSPSTTWGYVKTCVPAIDSPVMFGSQAGAEVTILAGKTAKFSRVSSNSPYGYLDFATLAPISPPGGVQLPYTPGSPPLTAFFSPGTPISFARVSPTDSTGFVSRGILNGTQEIVVPGSGTPIHTQTGDILQASPTTVTLHNITFGEGDLDGDGIPAPFDPNPGEFTDPHKEGDPSQFPADLQDKTLVLVGDAKMGVEKSASKTVTLPPGDRAYLIMLGVKSEEFPYYTGIISEWNDELTAEAVFIVNDQVSGVEQSGLIKVNDLHSSWLNNLNRTFLGYAPVDLRSLGVVYASSNHPTRAVLNLKIKNISDDILPTTGILSLVPVELGVDNNRDGTLALGSSADQTTAEKPYRFWLNNDDDRGWSNDPDTYTANIDNPWTPEVLDNADAKIEWARDLEDFARLHLKVNTLHDALESGTMTLGIKWKSVEAGAPKIRLFKAADADGGTKYLSDTTKAAEQVTLGSSSLGVVQGTDVLDIPLPFWTETASSATKFLLFEGLGQGKGELTLVLKKGSTVIGEAGSVFLNILDIRKMYERWGISATAVIPDPNVDVLSPISGVAAVRFNDPEYSSPPAWDEDKQHKNYVIHVHGWRKGGFAAATEAQRFKGRSDEITMFKRLWHRGFKGRYIGFIWPTYDIEVGDQGGWDAIESAAQSKFPQSEYRAWKCGNAFKTMLDSLPSDYERNVLAHSLGNVVVGSALEKGAVINHYAALNAAIPAYCYDAAATSVLAPYPDPSNSSNASTRALSYLGDTVAHLGKARLEAVTGVITNFYLSNDEAFTGWEVNQGHYPLQPFTGKPIEHYQYEINGEIQWDPTGLVNRIVTDPHETMAMVNTAHSNALGKSSTTGGKIPPGNNVNMDGPGMEFDEAHEAAFKWHSAKTWIFYGHLWNALGLPASSIAP